MAERNYALEGRSIRNIDVARIKVKKWSIEILHVFETKETSKYFWVQLQKRLEKLLFIVEKNNSTQNSFIIPISELITLKKR